MDDATEVRESVLREPDPLTRLAATLYNKPAVPSFSVPFTAADRDSRYFGRSHGYGGTRFLRWHELSDEQKDKVRARLARRLEEVGAAVGPVDPQEGSDDE
jgi:hypothetical protein